jgi:adenosine deaminase
MEVMAPPYIGEVTAQEPLDSVVGRPLRTLPKAHLHAHLDGSYPRESVQALALRNGMGLTASGTFTDVWEFFAAYATVPRLVQSHEDLAALCRALVHAEAAEGVLYFEPAIEPQLYAPRLGTIEQVTRTMLAAFAEAADDAGIEVGAMITINTDSDSDAEIAETLARLAAQHAGRGVTSLGTAGFVEPGNLSRFAPQARRARAAGLGVVSHAGQTGGPDSVEEALDQLGARRISHGIRSVESARLLERMAEEGIVCDVCPVSNVSLGLVPSLEAHPGPRLRDAGVAITLNADDQLWFGAGVTDQYVVAREVWGLDDRTVADIALAGIRATGMSSSTRDRFQAEVDVWMQQEVGIE